MGISLRTLIALAEAHRQGGQQARGEAAGVPRSQHCYGAVIRLGCRLRQHRSYAKTMAASAEGAPGLRPALPALLARQASKPAALLWRQVAGGPPVIPSCFKYRSRCKMGVSMMETAVLLSLT